MSPHIVRVTPSVPESPTSHDFGWALTAIKLGARLRRRGWNGRGMFVFFTDGSTIDVRAPLSDLYSPGSRAIYQSHIDMRTVDGTIVPWVCSQSDMLADDWEISP